MSINSKSKEAWEKSKEGPVYSECKKADLTILEGLSQSF